MDSDVSKCELDQLYGVSGVTRSLKRRRFSPESLNPGRRVTRRYISRLPPDYVTVSVQNRGLLEMSDQLSPGSYRQPPALVSSEESEGETDSLPSLAPESLDLSVSSEEFRYEEFVKVGQTVADISDRTSSSSSSSGADNGDEDDGSGGEDGDGADVTIMEASGGSNNMNGEFNLSVIIFCFLTDAYSVIFSC